VNMTGSRGHSSDKRLNTIKINKKNDLLCEYNTTFICFLYTFRPFLFHIGITNVPFSYSRTIIEVIFCFTFLDLLVICFYLFFVLLTIKQNYNHFYNLLEVYLISYIVLKFKEKKEQNAFCLKERKFMLVNYLHIFYCVMLHTLN